MDSISDQFLDLRLRIRWTSNLKNKTQINITEIDLHLRSDEDPIYWSFLNVICSAAWVVRHHYEWARVLFFMDLRSLLNSIVTLHLLVMLWGIIVEYSHTPNYHLYLPTGLWSSATTLKARPLLPSFLATNKTRSALTSSDALGNVCAGRPVFSQVRLSLSQRLKTPTINLLVSIGDNSEYYHTLK